MRRQLYTDWPGIHTYDEINDRLFVNPVWKFSPTSSYVAVSSFDDIPFAGDFGLLWHIWIFHYLGDVISWCEYVSADYGIFWSSLSFVWMVLVSYGFQLLFRRFSLDFVTCEKSCDVFRYFQHFVNVLMRF